MEGLQDSIEKFAPMGIDEYQEAIIEFDLLDGKIPKDNAHAFYIWLSRDPLFANIDGVSLAELYEKNVIETGMIQERFFQWCKDFDLPYPIESDGTATLQGKRFNTDFLAYEDERRSVLYETWAQEHGIESKEGTIMWFRDTEGNVFRVRTDADNRGEIIVD